MDDHGLIGFGLQGYQTKMIQGAIDSQSHCLKEIMIPYERVYTLRINKSIDQRSAKKILKHGYSRIPVYVNKDRNEIVGYLLIKTLVGVDLSEGKTIKELISDSTVTLRRPIYVHPNDAIGTLMTKFKIGRSHMAIVTDDPKQMEMNLNEFMDDDDSVADDTEEIASKMDHEHMPKVLGIVTLEDVIENILKEDILDEADYDLANDANVNFRPEKYADVNKEEQPLNQKEALQTILQKKIELQLTKRQSNRNRKYSDIYSNSNTQNNEKLIEMNDLKETLMPSKFTKKAAIRPQMSKPDDKY